MGDITKNFNYQEFLVSKDYPEVAKNMKLTLCEKQVIKLLCEAILQPLRNRFGAIKILSGKRSVKLNTIVGGSKTSDHLTTNAVDFESILYKEIELFKYIVGKNIIPYRQLIFYPEQNFIHVSINIPGKKYKHQVLVYEKGGFHER